jgi:hypothetical protein
MPFPNVVDVRKIATMGLAMVQAILWFGLLLSGGILGYTIWRDILFMLRPTVRVTGTVTRNKEKIDGEDMDIISYLAFIGFTGEDGQTYEVTNNLYLSQPIPEGIAIELAYPKGFPKLAKVPSKGVGCVLYGLLIIIFAGFSAMLWTGFYKAFDG